MICGVFCVLLLVKVWVVVGGCCILILLKKIFKMIWWVLVKSLLILLWWFLWCKLFLIWISCVRNLSWKFCRNWLIFWRFMGLYSLLLCVVLMIMSIRLFLVNVVGVLFSLFNWRIFLFIFVLWVIRKWLRWLWWRIYSVKILILWRLFFFIIVWLKSLIFFMRCWLSVLVKSVLLLLIIFVFLMFIWKLCRLWSWVVLVWAMAVFWLVFLISCCKRKFLIKFWKVVWVFGILSVLCVSIVSRLKRKRLCLIIISVFLMSFVLNWVLNVLILN